MEAKTVNTKKKDGLRPKIAQKCQPLTATLNLSLDTTPFQFMVVCEYEFNTQVDVEQLDRK